MQLQKLFILVLLALSNFLYANDDPAFSEDLARSIIEFTEKKGYTTVLVANFTEEAYAIEADAQSLTQELFEVLTKKDSLTNIITTADLKGIPDRIYLQENTLADLSNRGISAVIQVEIVPRSVFTRISLKLFDLESKGLSNEFVVFYNKVLDYKEIPEEPVVETEPEVEALALPNVAVDEKLVFYGSNTIGEKLMPNLIKAFLQSYGISESDLVVAEGEKKNETIISLKEERPGLPQQFEIKAHGSGTGFKALNNDETDLIMSSRPIKDKENDMLARFGDMTDKTSENVIALDGLAVIINPSNPVDALTREEIAKIFAGKITNWSEVGGRNGKINVYARDDKSGTYDTFNSLVMKAAGLKDQLSSSAQRFESSEALSDSVSADKNGIGFIGLAYILEAKPLAINECGIAYMPLHFYIKTEEYPLSRRLFIYIADEKKNDIVESFIEFVLSEKGQEIVQNTDFVNLKIEEGYAAKVSITQLTHMKSAVLETQSFGDLKNLIQLTGDHNRLSATFRFQEGKSILDNRGQMDIRRLYEFLNHPDNQGREIIVLGFADSQGRYSSNKYLSQKRAQTVAKELNNSGIKTKGVYGFSEEAPVACNTSDAGMKKNRHVQVWIK